MNLRKISFGNFKCLYDVSFEPGKVNVFIGANGSGKSTILEAIGLLSAAMTDRVDSASLQRRGVRLSVPSLYKSNFKSLNRQKLTVDLSVEWEDDDCSDIFQYDVHLTAPTDSDYWKYHSETFCQNGQKKWGRSNASREQTNNRIGFFLIDNNQNIAGRNCADRLGSYGIFQPNTMILRGISPDPNQSIPVGLNGGRLPEAVQTLIRDSETGMLFGDLDMQDVLDMIEWADNISVDSPKKSTIHANVSTTRQVVQFTDRYLKKSTQFTGYDASEGALYVLFMLALAFHPQAPSIFAVESFDHALNPRIAKRMIQIFCEQIVKSQKHVFLTTHNPFVLDGLNLSDDNIRLFVVERDARGYAQIRRISISQDLIDKDESLSRLWINGRLRFERW